MSGTTVRYGAGGGGGSYSNDGGSSAGLGGLGGGGNGGVAGSANTARAATPGAPNTGSGGGGGGLDVSAPGAAGGSGVVILRYEIPEGSGGNQAPRIVSAAWADPNPVTLPGTSALQVVASDPENDPLSYTWSQASGPGTVTFTPNGTAAADTCTATLSTAGTYVARVMVSDGRGGTATSEVTVVVNPSGAGADPRADCNSDGVVSALDLQIVVANFGKAVE
jgi:hypothetical protein